MVETKHYKTHCNCINKNIQINVAHYSDGGEPIKNCQELIELTPSKIAKEPIHECKFENTENCALRDYE